MSSISLYIPYVFKNINRHKIIFTFNLLKLGGIERVDLIPHPHHPHGQQAFVHMYDFNDQKHPQFRKRLNKGEIIKIVYDDPWYWKVSKSRSPKPPAKIPRWPHIIYNRSLIMSPIGPFHPTNKFPDQGCGVLDPVFKKGAQELKDWGPAEFTIGRH